MRNGKQSHKGKRTAKAAGGGEKMEKGTGISKINCLRTEGIKPGLFRVSIFLCSKGLLL